MALGHAHDIACELGHGYIGSEHLLLGLIREGSAVASKVLSDDNITEEAVTEKLSESIPKGAPLPLETELSLTPRSKKILEISAIEARRMKHGYIGTEHLLMAIIRDGDGVAAQILGALGANLGELYKKTVGEVNVEGEIPSAAHEGKRKTSTPTLDKFGRDLTEMARKDKFDPVIGRSREIERVI